MVKKLPNRFSISVSCGNIEILHAETPTNLKPDDLLNAFRTMTIIDPETPSVGNSCQSPYDDEKSVMIERCLPVPTPEVSNSSLMDKLVLPWDEKSWNVIITNAKSTVEVWARLIGPEYSVSGWCWF